MNSHQKLKAERLERRFSTGDGVRLADGRVGVVRSTGSDVSETGFVCYIDVPGEAEWVRAHETTLVSEPSANTGKYGGPTRGGAPGGYVGGNRYRSS